MLTFGNKNKSISKSFQLALVVLFAIGSIFLIYNIMLSNYFSNNNNNSNIIMKAPEPPRPPLKTADGLDFFGPVSLFQQIVDEFPAWHNIYSSSALSDEIYRKQLAQISEPVDILLFLSTWCPMARASVPPVMKTLDAVKNPNIRVKIIALDRQKNDPSGIAKSMGVTRVPTFVVQRNGVEIGRFTEVASNWQKGFIPDLLTVM